MVKKTSNHHFIRRQFYVPRDHSEFLRSTAYKRNISQARIVREAVREWAKEHAGATLSEEPANLS